MLFIRSIRRWSHPVAACIVSLQGACYNPEPLSEDGTEADTSAGQGDLSAGGTTDASAADVSTTGDASSDVDTATSETSTGVDDGGSSESGDASDGTTGGALTCLGTAEIVHAQLHDLLCDAAEAWSCPAGAPGCDPLGCADPISGATGWIRARGDLEAEQALAYTRAIEIAPPQTPGSSAHANFFFDLAEACNPVFHTRIACGVASACNGEYLVRVENLDDPDDYIEDTGPEGFDNDDTGIALDLSAFAGKRVVITLGFGAGDTASADDAGIFDDPRLVVTD